MIEIKNLPTKHLPFIVAQLVGDEFWYWGSWDDEEIAYRVAVDIGGQVFTRGESE